MEITAYWEGGYRCRVPVRSFELRADEPPQYGGTDAGPMPTELFLASLAICFTMAVYHAARKQDVDLSDLAVRVVGDYEGLRFGRLRVEVHSSNSREELESILDQAISYCYVSNTIRETPDLQFVVSEEPVTRAPLRRQD